MTEAAGDDFTAYRRRRVCEDLYARSLIGPPFYALACLLIGLVGNLAGGVLPAMLAAAGLFALLWLLRKRHAVPADPQLHARWEALQWLMVIGGYSLWAAVVGLLGAADQAPTLAVVIGMFATAAFAAAGAATFTSDGRRLRQCMAVLAAPHLLLWMPLYPELRVHAGALLIYLLYCLLLGRRLQEEYAKQLRLEYDLQSSRQALETMARTDALTGLWNRREYESVFGAAWQRRTRNISPLCLLILDLDDFKKINDSHGHQVGDQCLRHVSALLRRQFRRANDMVARIGGEEFAVILPDTERDEAVKLAEEFRRELATAPCASASGAIGLSASIGVAEVNMAQDSSPDASFARVDTACYEAKRGGRNRVAIA